MNTQRDMTEAARCALVDSAPVEVNPNALVYVEYYDEASGRFSEVGYPTYEEAERRIAARNASQPNTAKLLGLR